MKLPDRLLRLVGRRPSTVAAADVAMATVRITLYDHDHGTVTLDTEVVDGVVPVRLGAIVRLRVSAITTEVVES